MNEQPIHNSAAEPGASGQWLVFQTQACQMATPARILGMLPEADQQIAVESLEQVASQRLEDCSR
jgi:hypothetical protein